MKKRNLFAVLALSTLFACQSNEELGDSTVLMPTSNEKMLDLNLPSQLVASKIANNEAKKEYPNYSKSKSELLFSVQ